MNRLRTTGAALALLLALVGVPATQAAPMAESAAAAPVVRARPAWCIPLPWRKCPEGAAAAETAPVHCLALSCHKCPTEQKITPQPSETVTPSPKPLPTAQPSRVTPIGPPVPINPVAPPLAGAPARPQERVHPAPAAQSGEPVRTTAPGQADHMGRTRPVPPGPALCRQRLDRATDK